MTPIDMIRPHLKAAGSRPVRSGGRAGWVLAGVALAYGLGQMQGLRIKLGWDESIYLSQVSRVAPAAFFSAPRARGISWLVAAPAAAGASLTDLRLYLAVLSALALFVAYRIWFAVLPPAAVVVAAALFGGLWVTRFYGPQLMPNLWVAFGVVAAVGGFARVAADPGDRAGLVALPSGLATAAVMRPSDAAWVTASLVVAALVMPTWRRNWRLLLLTVAGAVIGAVPWVVEAYARFGGVTSRLRVASSIEGGLGWHPSALLQHWRAMDGPLLCRPCSLPATPPAPTWWWTAIPIALGIVLLAERAARRPGAAQVAGLPTALGPLVGAVFAGLAVALPYLLLIGYSAPRFVLPAFALLGLPVGVAAHWLVTATRPTAPRFAIVAVLILMAGAHLVVQQRILTRHDDAAARDTHLFEVLGTDLTGLGLTPPCAIAGTRSPQVAFATRCRSRNVTGHDASISAAGLRALAIRQPVALVLAPGTRAPAYAHGWASRTLPVSGRPAWTARLGPIALWAAPDGSGE